MGRRRKPTIPLRQIEQIEMIATPEPSANAEYPLQVPSASGLDDPSLYYSRELSWLEFNDRVLEEAFDPNNPLLERLKFMAIFSSNLDEYFMIRVAAIKQQIAAEVHRRSNDGRLPEEQLAAISKRLHRSLDRFAHLLRDEILPALERAGIRIARYDELTPRHRDELHQHLRRARLPGADAACDRSSASLPVHLESLALARGRNGRSDAGGAGAASRTREGPAELAALHVRRRSRSGVRPARRRDRAQSRSALSRNGRARFVFVPRDARCRPRHPGRRSRRLAARDRIRVAQAPLRRTGPARSREGDAGGASAAIARGARTRRSRPLRNRRAAGDLRSLAARQPRGARPARPAVHALDSETVGRANRYLRGDSRGRHPLASPVRLVRSGHPILAAGRRRSPKCWRSNRRSIARREIRRRCKR